MKTTILFIITCFGFFNLQGQGWVRQNPSSQFVRLNDVDFDSLYGLSVGNDGVLLTTNDGGNNWIYRSTPDADENLTTAFIVPGTNGQVMLAGGDSLLLLSTDGGLSWPITYDDVQGIFKIQVMPGGVWLVLGATYSIFSTDQGAVWQPIKNPALDAKAGHFTSLLDGWMSSGGFNNTQVWTTTNGGLDWEIRDSTKFTSITDIVMVNNLIGYLITGSQIFKTIDGGHEWVSENANPTGNITDLHVITQNEVWTSLDNGGAFYSLTGGNSWVERFPDLWSNNSALGIYADLSGHVYMPGKYVSMLYSEDFGLTWRDQIPGNKSALFQPHFYNELIGIVAGVNGTLMRTINGGDVWETIQLPKNDHLFAAMMLDDHTIVVGSSRGRVFFSDDLGMSWDTIGTGLGPITDLEAFNQQSVIVTTEEGHIYKTTDHGSVWNKEYDNGGIPLFALDFINAQKGWACGYQGEIVVTTDAGDNWTLQPTPGEAKFSDITFTTEQEGWAVSSSFTDSLWFTQDAGQSWQIAKLPYPRFWNGISFTNPDTGWIAGGVAGAGEILRTNDRGLTWSLNHFSPEIFEGIYAVPTIETVWAVGFGGNIMKYSPCLTEPMIADLNGVASPCKGDTVQYSVTYNNVDSYLWHFPPGWTLIGNGNASTVTVVAGNESGEIGVIGSNVCGNLTEALTLPATPIDIPQITIGEAKGNVLFTNVTSLEYQWLLNGIPIPGANGPFYTATENGSYQLIVQVPGTGCSGISNILDVTIVRTENPEKENLLLFPVPGKDLLYVTGFSGKNELEGNDVFLFAPDGRLVKAEKIREGKVNVSGLSPGIYLLAVKAPTGTVARKVVIE